MTDIIEKNDYFDNEMDAARLAKRLSTIQAFVDASYDVKSKAVNILERFVWSNNK